MVTNWGLRMVRCSLRVWPGWAAKVTPLAKLRFWQNSTNRVLSGFFFGQNRKTQFPIFKTQFRFFGQKTQLFLKNSAKTCEKTQFWVEKLSYFGENSVQKCQNSVFQNIQKRENLTSVQKTSLL